MAGDRARRSGWAARAAIAVAQRWRGPRRTVLVDLDLEQPALHALAGVENEEGADDVIAYGLSLSAVTQEAATGFAIVSAGLFTPDPEAVLRSDAWGRVLQDAAARRETLLAWLPVSAPGMSAFVQRAGAIIVLAEAGEVEEIVRRVPRPFAVLTVLTPAAGEPGAADTPDAGIAVASDVRASDAADDEPLVIAAAADEALSGAAAAPAPPGLADDEPLVIAAAADEALTGAPAPLPPAEADDATDATSAGEAPGDVPPPVQEPSRRLRQDEFEQIRLPTDRESRQALIRELRDRQRAARMVPPAGPEAREHPVADTGAGEAGGGAGPVLLPTSGSEHAREMRVEAGADDVDLDAIDPGPPAPRPSPYRRPLAWTLLLVLMLSVLAGAWRFLAGRLGWGVPVEGPTPPNAAAAPAQGPEPEPTWAVQEVELPWAVAIEAHADAARAENRANTLRSGAHQIPFHVVPLEREATRFYHVMAGPVHDSARAVALRDTLLARRLKTAETPTDIRYAPFAFLVGDYGTRAVAELQIEELLRLDIPAYLVLADAEDGYPLYRVYVGGYGGAGEAEVARRLLREAGVRDSLVTRTGSIVP